jgi:hypothetical protein
LAAAVPRYRCWTDGGWTKFFDMTKLAFRDDYRYLGAGHAFREAERIAQVLASTSERTVSAANLVEIGIVMMISADRCEDSAILTVCCGYRHPITNGFVQSKPVKFMDENGDGPGVRLGKRHHKNGRGQSKGQSPPAQKPFTAICGLPPPPNTLSNDTAGTALPIS